MTPLNETHDPARRSWVESANTATTDFPIQNLPLGVFRAAGGAGAPTIGVAIGDQILDLRKSAELGLLNGLPEALRAAVTDSTLNRLMARGHEDTSRLRQRVSRMLGADSADADPRVLVPAADVALALPAAIANYTDFYASVVHATHVGSLFRPENPLLPNYKHVPIAYHGRSSSIVVSGTPVRRPAGRPRATATAGVRPTRRLDYEAEIGFCGTRQRPWPSDSDSMTLRGTSLACAS